MKTILSEYLKESPEHTPETIKITIRNACPAECCSRELKHKVTSIETAFCAARGLGDSCKECWNQALNGLEGVPLKTIEHQQLLVAPLHKDEVFIARYTFMEKAEAVITSYPICEDAISEVMEISGKLKAYGEDPVQLLKDKLNCWEK